MTTPIICSIAISLPITPSEPLPAIPRSSLVIVEDRGPIWCYGMTLHKLHTLPLQQPSPSMILAWGAVVVATHSQEWQVGQVVDVTLPTEK